MQPGNAAEVIYDLNFESERQSPVKNNQSSHKTQLPALPFAVAMALVLLCVTCLMRHALVDDSFIYVKVASNIVSGHGWSYNLNDFINPCSGPLFVLLLVPLIAAGLPGDYSLLLLYGTGLWISSVMLWLILRRYGTYFAAAGVAVLLANMTLLKSFGMETSCALAVLLAISCLYENSPHRGVLTGLLIGLGHLLRPELALVLPLIVVIEIALRKRMPWETCVAAAAVFGAWSVFSYFYFGAALSHSVKVKLIQGTIGWWATQPPYYLDFLSKSSYPWVCFSIAAFGLLPVMQNCFRGRPAVLIICAYSVLLITAYSVASAPRGYFWYNAPAMLGVNLAMLFGLRFLSERIPGRHKTVPVFMAAGLAIFVTEFGAERLRIKSAEYGCSLTAAFPPPELDPVFRCANEYRAAADWINRNTEPQARVAMTEIGYLGYFSDRKVVDIHGLIHPEAFDVIRQQKTGWWFGPDYPEVIVTHDPAWPSEPGPNPGWWPPELYEIFNANYLQSARYGDVVVWVKKAA